MEILGLIDLPLWFIGIVTFVLSLIIYSKWKLSLWRRLGVPGPPPTLFMGNMGNLIKKGVWGAGMEYVQKYGKVYGMSVKTSSNLETDKFAVWIRHARFGSYIGHIPQITVADPELIKELAIKRFGSFPNRYRFGDPPDNMKGMLTVAVDEHWKFMRNTLTSTFSSGKMRLTSPVIDDCCEKLVENIKTKSKDGEEVIEFKDLFGCYTMDVIASTAFGIDVNSQKDTDNEFVKQAKKAFNVSFQSPLIILTIIFPSFGKLLRMVDKLKIKKAPFTEVFEFFNKVTLSIIEDRKAGVEKRKDFLQIMLNAHNETVDKEDRDNIVDYKDGDAKWRNRGLTTEEVTANSFLFFLAGYDTTANTMSFLAYNLAMNPECQEKCIEEVDRVLGKGKPDYDNVLKMEYLDNCMNETLRLHGPAPVTNRHVEEDTVVAGYKIPKDTVLNLSIYTVHHNPEYWPDPDKFDPDRFSQEEKAKRHPYAFLPFGHGPRNCIGMRLAYLEAKAAIASILQKYRLKRCEETEDPVIYDTKTGLLRAKNGIKLKVEPRKDI